VVIKTEIIRNTNITVHIGQIRGRTIQMNDKAEDIQNTNISKIKNGFDRQSKEDIQQRKRVDTNTRYVCMRAYV